MSGVSAVAAVWVLGARVAAGADAYALDQARHAAARGFWEQAWEALAPALAAVDAATSPEVQALAADIAVQRADPAAWAHARNAAALATGPAAEVAAARLDWMSATFGTVELRCAPQPCGASAQAVLSGGDPAAEPVRGAAVARLGARGAAPRSVLVPAGAWTIDGVGYTIKPGQTRVVRAARSRQPGWELEPGLGVAVGAGPLAVPGPAAQLAGGWRAGPCVFGAQADAALALGIGSDGRFTDPGLEGALLGRVGCDTHPRRPVAPGLIALAGVSRGDGRPTPALGLAVVLRHAPGGHAGRPGPALQVGLRWTPDAPALRVGPTLLVPL